MTQEEKAKAYDKALERAEKALEVLGTDKCEGARQIFSLFPELKESEDERIRKKLIDTFNFYDPAMNSPFLLGIDKKDIIAWLERQNSNVDNANKEYWRGYREGKQEILDKYAEFEKQGTESVNIDIESMVSSYEQRLKSQGQGNLENNPLINM